MKVEAVTPGDYLGDVTGDLNEEEDYKVWKRLSWAI